MTPTDARSGSARRASIAVAALFFLGSAGPAAPGQQPDLAAVLEKAAARAAELAAPDRMLICEERYKQLLDRVRSLVGYDMSGPVGARSEVSAVGVDKREWVAELALLATPGNDEAGFPWREFRDIYLVDGKPRREGVPRFARLAAQPPDVAGITALEWSQEASAYMFGRLLRAVDIPRAAQVVLHASNQRRFAFRKGGQKTIGGVKALEVKFRETASPTILRASGGADAASTGSFWIDPATGDVLLSVLKSADTKEIYDELTVSYARVPELGVCLPATLTERVIDDPAAQRVQATATFTGWKAVPRKKG
jgi:hypothetical protein